MGFKVAFSGKGGVGKTTLAGGLSRFLADNGFRIIAVDADPDANLASSIGISENDMKEVIPISDMKSLIAERTGSNPGTYGTIFKMNPKVDDLPEALSVKRNGISLLVMGTVKEGGGGCVCPESVLLKALLQNLLLMRKDVVVLDMEAGLEHLGRATSKGIDLMIVVVEPGKRSVQTAAAIKKLAAEIGVERVAVAINKIENNEEADAVRKEMEKVGEIPIIGTFAYRSSVKKSDLAGKSPYDEEPVFVKEIENLWNNISGIIPERD